MSQDVFAQKGSSATPDNRDVRAQRAIKAFRSMQPGLTGFAKALTGKKNVQVVLDHGAPRTDGTKIFFKPPIALGDLSPHERRLCDKRDANKQQKCAACRVREEVIISIVHEIAHIAFGTFETVSNTAKNEALTRAIEEAPSKWAARIREGWEKVPDAKKGDYLNLSSLISPYLPLIVNGLEDARVDEAMFKVRKGTRVMFDAYIQSVFAEGIPQDDGSIAEWRDKPLNSQVIIGTFVLASGYTYEGWFHEDVEAALADTQLRELCQRVGSIRSAAGTYELSFPILARIRELGFCRVDDEPEDEPEESEEESEEQETPEEETDEESDGEGEPDPEDHTSEGDGEPGDQGDQGDSDEESPDDGDDGTSGGGSEAPGEDEGGSEGAGSDGTDAGADSAPTDGDDGLDDQGVSEGDEPSSADEREGGNEDGADQPAREGGKDGESGSEADGVDEESEASGDDQDSDDASGDGGGSSGSGDEDAGEDGSGGDSDGSGYGPDSEASEGDAGSGGGGDLPDDSGRPDEDDGDGSSANGGAAVDGVPAEGEKGEPTEAGTDSAGPGQGRENLTDLPDDDSDEAVDTGADEGHGGTTTDKPEYGGPKEAIEDVQVFGQHEVQQVQTADPSEAQEDDRALDLAIVQGQYFEQPSVNVAGVREHRYGKDSIGYAADKHPADAWDNDYPERLRKKLGVDTDLEIDESVLGPALIQMRKTFGDNARHSMQRHLKSGRINGRVLGKRAPVNDIRLFQKKRLPGKRSYAVLIGIDISGSTVGANLALAKRAAMAQAELCSRTGIDFAIYAHTANGDFGVSGGVFSFMDLSLDMYEIKAFDQAWDDKSREALGAIGSNNQNLDGHGIEYYRKLIEKHPATDRVILYYTDGKMPAANHDEELEILIREIAVCKRENITLCGVGIRTDSPRRHGLDTVQVDGDEDLIKVVRHLEKVLLHNR